jgi:hypothetical protein
LPPPEENGEIQLPLEENGETRSPSEGVEEAQSPSEKNGDTRLASEEAEEAQLSSEKNGDVRLASEGIEEAQLPSEKNDEAQLPSEEVEKTQLPSQGNEEAQLPPEAQGEVNGGPLGCCLGTMIGLLLCISIALASRFYADPLVNLLGNARVLGIITRVLMVLVAIAAVIICGYFGWRIGKSVYREYDPPVVPERGERRR